MHDVFALLAGGDRRSIGNVNAVFAAVENNPSFFEVAFYGLLSEDVLIRTRVASSTEFCEAEKTIPTQETNSGQKTV